LRKVGVKFWAWTASIVVHLTVLTAFGVATFSRSETQDKCRSVPTAKLRSIEKLMRPSPRIPKPKIKKPAKNLVTAGAKTALSASRIFTGAGPDSLERQVPAKPSTSSAFSALEGDAISSQRIEFFGSSTDERKLCYLVDCSGSMRGIFSRVRKELKESVKSLQPDQYFCIVFFGGDRLYEFGKGRLLRATPRAKSAAYAFADSVRPAGSTNALAALEKAVQIHDSRGVGPSVVYFLTDGFELTGEDVRRTSQKIVNLLKRFSPTTRINTIGFWPQAHDRKMLKAIASQSGGEFVSVSDSIRQTGTSD